MTGRNQKQVIAVLKGGQMYTATSIHRRLDGVISIHQVREALKGLIKKGYILRRSRFEDESDLNKQAVFVYGLNEEEK